MSTSAIKGEKALIAYLKTICPTLRFYAGHGSEEMKVLPRCIVTFAEGTELCEGVDEMPGQIQLLSLVKKKPTVPDPIVQLSGFVNEIRASLSDTHINEETGETSLDEFLAFVNVPPTGPDDREVKGFGMSGLNYEGFTEGRDEQHNHHGVVLSYRAWAHLEEEAG